MSNTLEIVNENNPSHDSACVPLYTYEQFLVEKTKHVWNKHSSGVWEDAVCVGRPSVWGNPFPLTKYGNRVEVIWQYIGYLATRRDLLLRLDELCGKDLICWCAPQLCHADVLFSIANRYDICPCDNKLTKDFHDKCEQKPCSWHLLLERVRKLRK